MDGFCAGFGTASDDEYGTERRANTFGVLVDLYWCVCLTYDRLYGLDGTINIFRIFVPKVTHQKFLSDYWVPTRLVVGGSVFVFRIGVPILFWGIGDEFRILDDG